ncbi:MAG: hypothetical protein ABSD74_10355 [Rhizomicrobium sp.]
MRTIGRAGRLVFLCGTIGFGNLVTDVNSVRAQDTNPSIQLIFLDGTDRPVQDSTDPDDDIARCVRLSYNGNKATTCLYPKVQGETTDKIIVESPERAPGKKTFSVSWNDQRNQDDQLKWVRDLFEARLGLKTANGSLRPGDYATFEAAVASARMWLFEARHAEFAGRVVPLARVPLDSADIPSDDPNSGAAPTFAQYQAKVLKKLETVLDSRASLMTALGTHVDSEGLIDETDYGIPLLSAIAGADQSSAPGASLDDRLQKLLEELHHATSRESLDQPTGILAEALAPQNQNALSSLFSSPYFREGISPTSIQNLESLANSPQSSPDGFFIWGLPVAAALVALMIGLATMYYLSTSSLMLPQLTRRVARKNGFDRTAEGLHRFLTRISSFTDVDDYSREAREHFIWLITRGGYRNAVNILRSRSLSAQPPDDATPELERLAYYSVFAEKEALKKAETSDLRDECIAMREFIGKTVAGHDVKYWSDQDFDHRIKQTLADVEATYGRPLSIREILETERARYDRLAEFLKKLLQVEGRDQIAQGMVAGDEEACRIMADAVNELQWDRGALQDAQNRLGRYSAGAAPFGAAARDVVRAQCESANRTAGILERAALERAANDNRQDISRRDAETLAEFVAGELRRVATQSRQLDDRDRALEVLRGSPDPDLDANLEEVEEAVKSLLRRIGLLKTDVAAKTDEIRDEKGKYRRLDEDFVNQKEATRAAQSGWKSADDLLAEFLKTIVGVDQSQIEKLKLRGASHFDFEATRGFVSNFDRKIIALQLARSGLEQAAEALKQGDRAEIAAALDLPRILSGLAGLEARCIQLLEPSPENANLSKEARYKRLYVPGLEDGWLHLLFRADAVLSTYFGSQDSLRWVKTFISQTAKLIELMLRDIAIEVVKPALLATPPEKSEKKFGAKREFRALKEVRDILAPFSARGDVVAVDIYEIGIECEFRHLEPSVYILSPAEWSQ